MEKNPSFYVQLAVYKITVASSEYTCLAYSTLLHTCIHLLQISSFFSLVKTYHDYSVGQPSNLYK
jgi:hypothetical protein